MARLSAHLHLHSDDIIRAGSGGDHRWIDFGDQLGLFASDEKMVELRDAIDAYLAQGERKARAA